LANRGTTACLLPLCARPCSYGITENTFKQGWGAGLELKLNEGGSSQAFFFFSEDKRFIVKSCTVEEMELLRSMAEVRRSNTTKHQEVINTKK